MLVKSIMSYHYNMDPNEDINFDNNMMYGNFPSEMNEYRRMVEKHRASQRRPMGNNRKVQRPKPKLSQQKDDLMKYILIGIVVCILLYFVMKALSHNHPKEDIMQPYPVKLNIMKSYYD